DPHEKPVLAPPGLSASVSEHFRSAGPLLGLPQVEFVYPVLAKPGAVVGVYGRNFITGDAVFFSGRHLTPELLGPGLIQFRLADDAQTDHVSILRDGFVVTTSDDLVKVIR